MKLLLTSGGLRNPTLSSAVLDLAGQPASKLKIAIIPTAMNPEPRDKSWYIDQLIRIRHIGFLQVDFVDISALPKDVWLPRLEECDIIFVSGGNTSYLMDCFNKFGLTEEIPRLLKDRVYVGSSAGSIVATPDLRFNTDDTDVILDGLKLVGFGLQVHLHSPKFPIEKSDEAVKKQVAGCPYKVYALNDQMAVKLDGKKTEVVGEGVYLEFDPEKS